MIRRTLLFSACLAVSGCSDPTGPCDRAFACEVSGVDLAVIDSHVVEGELIGTDPVTGSAVYAAGRITVEFTVVNRGDSASAEQPVSLMATRGQSELLPPMEPGETATFRMTRDYSDDFSVIDPWNVSADSRTADHTFMSLTILQDDNVAEWPDNDADIANNTLSHQFHVAIPVFAGTLSDVAEMRQNQPLPVSIRFENLSLRNASGAGYDAFLCVWDIHIGCTPQWWTYFERFSLPDLAVGEVFDTSFAATLPAAAMAYPEASFTGTLLLCIMPSNDDADFEWAGPIDCVDAKNDVVFRPDYQSCNPPVVVLGEPLALAAPNCGLDTTDEFWHYYVAAFDAIAGQMYAVEGYYQLHNSDGDYTEVQPSGFTVPTSGRWYLVRTSVIPETLIVRRLD